MSHQTAAPPQAETTPERRKSLRRREVIAAYLFVTPFFLVFIAMIVVPLFYSGYLSTFRAQLIGGTVFVGAENYIRALQDDRFIEGVLRMARFLLIQVPIMLGLALLFALVLDSGRLYLKRFVRLGIFVPYAVPSVIAALMWGYLYGPDFGPFAQAARALDLPAPRFLSGDWMLGSIMNIVTWGFIGYNMVIIYSALRSIPSELYEAAKVDGAGEVRVAWSIKIPADPPGAAVDDHLLGHRHLPALQRAEPAEHARAQRHRGRRTRPNLYAYNLAFVNQEINYAAAIAFLLGFVIMVVSYVVQLSQRSRGVSAHDHRPARGRRRRAAAGPSAPSPSPGVRRTVLTVAMLAAVAYFLLPLVWIVVASTKSNADLFSTFGLWFADDINLADNLRDVFTFQGGIYLTWLRNTILYAVVSARRRRGAGDDGRVRVRQAPLPRRQRCCSRSSSARSWSR